MTAEAAYREAAAAGNADAAYHLGLLLSDRGDLEGALAAYEQAAGRGHAEATLNLALALAYELGRRADARELFWTGIKRGDVRAMFELAFLVWFEGDLGAAEEVLRTAAQAGEARAYLHIGFLTAEDGRQEEAISAFRHAAADGVQEAWTQLGWEYARMRAFGDAEQALQQAVRAGDPASYVVLGGVLDGLARTEDADLMFERAHERAREVSLGYRDMLDDLAGEGESVERLREWAREEWDSRAPLELVALLFDAARLAEADTRLRLRMGCDDDEARRKLTDLYNKTGRQAQASQLRRRPPPNSV